MRIGERVTLARSGAGMSKADLARATGISKQGIGKIENGETKSPTPENLLKIANATNSDLISLITGEMAATESKETANRRARLQVWINNECGGSQAKFIELTGINQGELSGLLRDKSFGEKKARKLEGQAGMPDYWLDSSSIELRVGNISHSMTMGDVRLAVDDTVIIQQHTEVHGAMGHGTVLNDGHDGAIQSWRVTKEWAVNNLPSNTGLKNLRIVTGKGDSMIGMYNDGDPLIIDTGIITVDYDAVYFFRIGERGYIKRLQGMPDGTLLAISKNQDYRDFVIDETMDFHVFGRVLKVWKGENL